MTFLACLDKLLLWPPAAREVLLSSCSALSDEQEKQDEKEKMLMAVCRVLEKAA